MKITIRMIGTTRDSCLREGIAGYVKRLSHYVPLTLEELPDVKTGKKPDKERIKLQEGELLLNKIRPGEFIILLDEKGKEFTSVEFSNYLSSLEGQTGSVLFLIGGAYGFSRQVYERANARISLSKMTFSHQMVRLIFTEQLYRAYTILKGEPYHHA